VPSSAVHAFYNSEQPDASKQEENSSNAAQNAHLAYLTKQAQQENIQTFEGATKAFY